MNERNVGSAAEPPRQGAEQAVDRLYVCSQSGGIAAIDLMSDGSMRALPDSPYPSGAGAFALMLTPDAQYLYSAAGLGLGSVLSVDQPPQVESFRVRPDGGLEELVAPLPLEQTPVTLAMSPDGRNLYVGVGDGWGGMNGHGAVVHFRIGEDGTPVQVGDAYRLGRDDDGVPQPAVSRDGAWLYVLSFPTQSVIRFRIHNDGTLSKEPIDRVATGDSPINPMFSPDGRHLYVANERVETITVFAIAPDGSLSPVPGSPFPSSRVPHNFVFSADGTRMYSGNTGGHTISGFAVRPDGGLDPLPYSPYAAGSYPMRPLISTDGARLYLVYSDPDEIGDMMGEIRVASYLIQANGSLLSTGQPPARTGIACADGDCAALVAVQR
ncbi:MAG: beta-propeller fold lactonase family protein [Arachnia sp.]